MKSKSTLGGSFAVRACVALMASGLAMTFAAAAQAVLQVPTSTRVAGSTVSGYNQDFGPAISTDLSNPTYTVFDAAGNQYVSDTGNNCVRKISASTGDTSVLVGYEATASSSDTCNTSSVTNISPTQGVVAPKGLALDSTGDLFIADSGHNCIRELVANTTGSKSLQAVVDTCTNYAPVGLSTNSVSPSPTGLIIDYEGDIIASIADSADNINQVIFHGVGNPKTEVCDLAGQTSAAVFNACPFFNGLTYVLNSPNGLAIDQAGNYYLADTGNSCVRELSATNVVTTPIGVCASDGSGTTAIPNFSPVGLAVGNQGYLYVSNANQATVLQYTGGSAAPWIFAGIPGAQTTVYTGAQEGIAGVDVSLNSPTGLSVDASGNIYVADSGNGIVRQLALNAQFSSENLKNASTAQTLQFEISSAVNLTATPGLDFQISNGNNTCTGSLTASATTTPTTCEVSLFFDPTYPGLRRSPLTLFDTISNKSFAFGLSGIGEGANALFIPGTINTLASGLGNPSAVVNSTTGNTYFAESGATLGAGDIKFIPSGTSTVITLVPPYGLIEDPVALVLDSAQNLYVADSAANSIFKVDANGHVTTFASGLSDPVAVAVDSVGNVYVAQDGAGADDVLKIYAGGQQVVIAGLGNNAAPNGVAAAQAQFVQPSGLYLDANNVLYVSDAGAYRVYDIDTTGIIHFFAGNGTQTSTNPLVPTGVGLQGPSGLVGDAAGDVYIADGPANLLYVVFGGSNQNPGIQALVGTGAAGNSGDAAAANLAQLNNPVSVALDGLDDLYLVDAGNSSVREVNYQQPILNFGNVKPGTTSAPLMTTLWDSGNSNLTSLTQFLPQNTADFAQVSSGCGGTLQQGSTCNLTYDFTPPTYGTYQTTATSNASAVNPQQIVTLMGASPQPTLSVPNATAVYGTAYTLSASITSSGTAPTGTITFAITLPAGNAQTLCNNVPVAANGTATCSPSPTLLDVIAGGYTFAAEYSGDTNYLPLTQTATLIITPAPVTITADNFTRPYNTPNPTFTGTITGVVAGQSITDTYTTSATQLSAPGTYPIAPGNPPTAGPGTLLSDYTITVVNGTLTITQNSGSVSINSPAVTSVYGTAYTLMSTISSTSAPTPTGTASFSIGAVTLCSNVPLTGGVVSCSPSPTLENVGSYTVTVSYSGDTFYPAATSSINLTITPAPVTITANNTSRQYDTPNPTFTGTITGVAAGQSITDTYSTSAVLLSPPGNYPISPTNPPTAGPGTLLSNYIIIVINGTLTITQDTTGLIFNTPAVTAVYGNAYTLTASITSSQTPAPTGTVTFSIAGQPICATATLVAGTATCTPSPTLENAGAYTVTVAYSGDTYYLAATSDLSLTVMPAPVTITAANASRPYDTANPTFTGTVVPQYPFPAHNP
jgi:sugar lactone lactonase YvrE